MATSDDDLLKVAKSIDFWLGAIATNIQVANRLRAQELGVECVWWDPNVEPFPKPGEHGETASLTKIRVALPTQFRKGK